MKSSRSDCKLAIVLTLAGLLHLVEAADDVNKFRRCYNTSVETHCFDAQYDTTNNRWLNTTFDNARKRCLDLNSTLLIIKNEETNQLVIQYFNEPNNPITGQYVWTDAYRVNDLNSTYTWHWIDSTLPTIKASDVTFTPDYRYYVAVLEFRDNSFYLTAKGPDQQFNYICEYPASKCPISRSSNVRQFNGRCYAAYNAKVNWYEARNRCIKDGGDLASFVNVTSINFISWLDAVPYTQYFIGLQFTWYTWIDIGEKVRYSNWKPNGNDQNQPFLSALYANQNLNWYPKESSAIANVVCQTVTPINPPTTSTKTSTISTTIITTSTSSSSTGFQNVSKESSEGRASNSLAIGVGVGVGIGIPVIVAISVLVTCIVMRSGTFFKKNASNNAAELGAVRESPVGQISDSTNDQYQQLNRSQKNSSGPTYDKLKVVPEQPYEELPSNIA